MRETNHKDGLGTVTFGWEAEKENPYKFAGYRVAAHDERAHTYESRLFDVSRYNEAINAYIKACKLILGDN